MNIIKLYALLITHLYALIQLFVPVNRKLCVYLLNHIQINHMCDFVFQTSFIYICIANETNDALEKLSLMNEYN